MTHRLIFSSLLLLSLVSITSAACEADLIAEFSRLPNDERDGRITDQVPINIASLTAAYSRGIFPWSVTAENNGVWYSPPTRGILDFTTMEIPGIDAGIMRKMKKKGRYRVEFNKDFRQVITSCANQERSTNNWITNTHIEEFVKLHEAGLAHSIEVWEGDVMVGGMYGVYANGFFSGESMFHKAPNVTKLAYEALVERLKSNGHTFMDTQQNLGLTKQWGGKTIPRAEFNRLIEEAAAAQRPF